MKIFIGDKVTSDFGTGPLVAVTKEWVVHNIEDGSEVAVPIGYAYLSVPAELPPPGGGRNFVDLNVC